jgi:hypothetical protein
VIERIERADMATLYTIAAVLLFPSHYEGFGLSVLAAQMCGTPSVCSDQRAVTDMNCPTRTEAPDVAIPHTRMPSLTAQELCQQAMARGLFCIQKLTQLARLKTQKRSGRAFNE